MSATDYLPIRVSTLRGDLQISFDTYVLINQKYILFCRKGDSFEGERLSRLKKKKLRKMYILTNDEKPYREYMTQSIETAYDKNSGKNINERSEVIQGAQQAATEEVMERPEDKDSYEFSKLGTHRYVDFILNENEALKSVMKIKNADGSVAHHGVTVATLAISMAQKLGLQDSKPMDLLTLGALLHDIEHTHNELNLARPLSEMSKEDLNLYHQHPSAAIHRLQGLNHFDQVVLDIILNHEEKINGSGFPNQKKEGDLDILTQIVSVANSYDRMVAFEGREQKEALKEMFTSHLGAHKLELLQCLQSVLKEKEVV